MDFNYSYRSLIITTLLFGILFLAFKSITLSKYVVVPEENFDVEYSDTDLLLEEELLLLSQRDLKVETNRAFNEAEKFISDLENERETTSENIEGKEQNDDDVKNLQGENVASNKKVSAKKKQDLSNGTEKTKKVSTTNSSKRNSTVSYKLVQRTALYLPNPVYTCDGFGKIIIDIEVTETGRVKKATYNKRESTTKNECLIDNAIAYAKSARFTTTSRNITQEGTISYNFPGQQ